MTTDKIAIIRAELRKKCLQTVADKLDLSHGCLYAIREGKTKWPQLRTLNKLLPYLYLEIEIRQMSIQDKTMNRLTTLSVAGGYYP